MKRDRLFVSFVFCACVLLSGAGPAEGQTKEWLPIAPEELAMKDNPKAPGSHAMVLYREDYTDDNSNSAHYYYRVKIFTEEGKKYANIEIQYDKDLFKVGDIKARSIRPDGSVAEFNG